MTVRIAAVLAWWHEPPHALERLVRSLAGVADLIVEADGPWQGTPHTTTNSPSDQRLALTETAIQHHIPIHSISPPAYPWPSQVDKRHWLMHAAHARTTADWILVVDGDEHIAEADPYALRETLATTPHDVALIMLRNIEHDTEYTGPIRRLYRASTGVHLPGPAHNAYQTKDGRWLHGDPAYVTLETPETATTTMLTLNHNSQHRTPERKAARAAYRHTRRAQHLEDWRAARTPSTTRA